MDATPSSDELLQGFLADPEEAVVGFRLDGSIFLWNHAAEALHGYATAEILGKSVTYLLTPHESAGFTALLSGQVHSSTPARLCLERVNKSGRRISLNLSRSLIQSAEGEPLGFLERARESSMELTQAAAETHLQFLVEKLPLYFWTTDRRLQVTSHWGSTARPASDFPANSVGQSVQEFLRINEASESPVKQHFLALRGMASRFEYATHNRLYDVSIEPYFDSRRNVIGCVGMALDITERRKSEDEIRYRATHDGLTGLVNYREFVDSLEREVRGAAPGSRRPQSDQRPFRPFDGQPRAQAPGRHHEGTLPGHRSCRSLWRRRIRNSPAQCRRRTLRSHPESPVLSVSLGLSVFPGDGPAAADLLQAADKRLYQDKKSGSNRTARHVEQKG